MLIANFELRRPGSQNLNAIVVALLVTCTSGGNALAQASDPPKVASPAEAPAAPAADERIIVNLAAQSQEAKTDALAEDRAAVSALNEGRPKEAQVAASKAQAAVGAAQVLAMASGDSKAISEANAASASVSTSEATPAKVESAKNICAFGKRFYHPCFYAGAILASASWVGTDISGKGALHGGETTHTLISTVIPTAGLRFALEKRARVAADIGALSMLLSKDLSSSSSRKGCRITDSDFEKKLPCEGNVSVSPVLAGYVGITIGTEDIGLLSVMYMMGAARTSLDNSIYFYQGLAVGVISLSKVINFGGDA